MKLLDTNVFLRAIAELRTPHDRRMHDHAATLFAAVEAGDEEVTTYETVIDEIFYVLCSPRHYGLSHADAVNLFLPILDLDGLYLPRKRIYADALELFASTQALDFTDCLLAVYAQEDGHDLVTFDRRLAQTAGVKVLGG